MYKNVLENINGVGIYPVVGLIIFLVFFVSVIVWIVKLKKSYLSKMSYLPLDNNFHKEKRSSIYEKY